MKGKLLMFQGDVYTAVSDVLIRHNEPYVVVQFGERLICLPVLQCTVVLNQGD